uniref:Uncharacterized protein n=1 Tax=Clastoptera arizonana TaxID=38151 RepID=A0A1B6EC44_9HEMI
MKIYLLFLGVILSEAGFKIFDNDEEEVVFTMQAIANLSVIAKNIEDMVKSINFQIAKYVDTVIVHNHILETKMKEFIKDLQNEDKKRLYLKYANVTKSLMDVFEELTDIHTFDIRKQSKKINKMTKAINKLKPQMDVK